MIRVAPWLLLVLWPFPMAACKKPETACQKKCKKLLACYQETRGAVPHAPKSLAHCVAVCKGESEGKGEVGGKDGQEPAKALESFGSMDCAAWMRRHRTEADHLLAQGEASPDSKIASGAPEKSADHPFPKLISARPGGPKTAAAGVKPLQERVDRIVITTPRETVELRRHQSKASPKDEFSWDLVRPFKGLADRIAVRNLLNRLGRLGVQGRAKIAPRDYASQQLTEKQGVRCQVYAGDAILADMIVGRADRQGGKGRGGVTTLIRPVGSDQIWRVTGALSYLFNRSAEGWKDASLIHLKQEDIEHLSLVLPGGRLVLRRNSHETDPQKKLLNWEILESEPSLASLDQNAILRLVSVLTHLRATSFEKDLASDKTGLDKPRARVTLRDKGGKTVTLLIGNRDAARRSAYGQLQGDPRVFSVRHPLDALPEEPVSSYRDKTLVRADLNQVVGLLVEKEGETAEFAKEGTLWKAVSPEGLKPNMGRLLGAIRLLEGRFSGHELVRDAKPETTGLKKPRGRILVKLAAQKDAPPKTVELLVGQSGSRGDVYVQVKGEKDVMLVRKWILDRIWQLPGEWANTASRTPPSRPAPVRPRVDK